MKIHCGNATRKGSGGADLVSAGSQVLEHITHKITESETPLAVAWSKQNTTSLLRVIEIIETMAEDSKQ
jgi:hypothetical protein